MPAATTSSVPFVVEWTGETRSPAALVMTPQGIAYANPGVDVASRVDDVLWEARVGTRTGRPRHAVLHPARLRDVMQELRCAGCKGLPDRTADGVPWVLPLLADEAPGGGWEGVLTSIPPMCQDCASAATTLCPWLSDGYVKLRVRQAEHVGVRGNLYRRPGESETSPELVLTDVDTLVRYDSPDLPFVVAREPVRELRECTVIELVDPHTVSWSARTLDIIRLLVQGIPHYRVADMLDIGRWTMEHDIILICQQLGIDSCKYLRYMPVVVAAIRRRVVHLPPLTPVRLRERLVKVLVLMAAGYTNRQIAGALGLTENAVKNGVKEILRALDARSRLHAVARGWQCGILDLDSLWLPSSASAPAPAGQVRA
ncbi:helix-turn-helix transcriptional regulator [Streptomyces achromogenes]|uniref:helix-turn-helix transcriptional regulator n=1 Tax=Streptomyces achromogenes TaxID=67255 RepID=UPI0033E53EE2